MDLHTRVDQVHDPVLGNTRLSVQRQFDITVEVECGVSDFNQHQNIRSAGIRIFIEVNAGSNERNIRFGFAITKSHRILNAHDPPAVGDRIQQRIQSLDAGAMGRTDRHFLNDLSSDEFDLIVLIENPAFDHLFVVIDCEAVAGSSN